MLARSSWAAHVSCRAAMRCCSCAIAACWLCRAARPKGSACTSGAPSQPHTEQQWCFCAPHMPAARAGAAAGGDALGGLAVPVQGPAPSPSCLLHHRQQCCLRPLHVLVLCPSTSASPCPALLSADLPSHWWSPSVAGLRAEFKYDLPTQRPVRDQARLSPASVGCQGRDSISRIEAA